MPIVTIIDYGLGNLLSVTRAFLHCGAEVRVADSAEDILRAERLVLPGVGAFADGMDGLKAKNFIAPILKYASTGKPFLGICLGMQLMMDASSEFGFHQGLGLIAGNCVAIPNKGVNDIIHKVPHIGWNQMVRPDHQTSWDGTILDSINPEESVYFVHSFSCCPDDQQSRLADTWYNGLCISSVLKYKNLYGCQFHPEKSGEIGLRIIKNFTHINFESEMTVR